MKKRVRLSKEEQDFLGLPNRPRDADGRSPRYTLKKEQFKKLSKLRAEKAKGAKVLIFDLETAPMLCYTWGKWNQNIQDNFIVKDWYVLSWSAKWLFDDEVISMKLTKKEVLSGNDERIMRGIWNLLDEADAVIAHNLKNFDRKKANTRFIKYDMKLPSSYAPIDTLIHARKQFKITSNRLDYLGEFLGLGRKMETEKGLWMKCVNGDMEAMHKMDIYCQQDVRLLEDVYLKMRPYIQPHPNLGLNIIDFDAEQTCPTCGHGELNIVGEYHTTVNSYDNYRCSNCGALSRSRKANTSIKKNTNIMSSVPR